MVLKCSTCSKDNIPSSELAFNKVGDSSWGLVCKDCLDILGVEWSKPGELKWLGPYAGICPPETYQLLSQIKENNGHKADKLADNERRYERHSLVLKGFIKTSKDSNEEILAIIKDLSKGGLRFVSKSEFSIAQIASIRIERKNSDTPENTISENIEIMRVIPQKNGTFEMGARFLSAETAELEKKSKNPQARHNILLKVRYKVTNNTPAATGAVLELGRKTALILVTCNLRKGSKFAMQISGNSGVFANQELSGLAEVKRTELVYAGNYEVLVNLIKVNITKTA